MIRSRRYLFFSVFVAGATTLAIEFTTSRLLQTVYGTSNLVWANVIGLVLLFLTTGYFLGGRLADRRPEPTVYFTLLTVAGLSSVFFLLLTSVILKQAAAALAALNVGAILASLLAVIFALAVPITLLGCISPFAIRLGVQDVGEAGRISGQIYAISTLGSLLGTYIPTLVLIPLTGSRITAVIFGGLLIATGLFGLRTPARGRALTLLAVTIALAPLFWWWSTGPLKLSSGHLFEVESPYNYIEVVRRGECNYLLLNEGQAYHSYWCDEGRVPTASVWEMMAAAPFILPEAEIDQIERAAIIGSAAGTIPQRFLRFFPNVHIDGIEIDPAIVEAGNIYFDMAHPRLETFIGDGRYAFNQLDGPYDIVVVDAYRVPYIPWHLTTKEFFDEIAARLTDDGVVAINVGRVPSDRRLVEALTATMQLVYPSVHTVDVPGTLNTIVIGTMQPTDEANLRENAANLPAAADPLLRQILQIGSDSLVETVAGDVVFTDNRAPVETIVDSLVINYILDAGFENLPQAR
ncbi:MAG: fused MFS/spermidine synthase [Ardenticatenaceae bacterium]|nr:fused MFS/spermidine synthase [Ardenticatenaceae bacterium]